MNKLAAAPDASVTDITPTPYIAVAANFYGTGDTAQAARKALVKAGGSPQEDQTVFKLPDGAVGAYVADKGSIHWRGVDSGEATPVYRYKAGKSVKVIATAQAWKAPGKKSKQPADAQNLGEVHPEPEISGDGSDDPGATDKESTIATVPAGKPKRVRVKPDQLAKFVVGDKAQWTSGPMSNRVTHVGDVTHIIPANELPPAGLLRGTDGRDTGRTVESYIVREGNRNYWPHTSALSKPETMAVVPTTGEVVEPSTPGAVEVPAQPESKLPVQTALPLAQPDPVMDAVIKAEAEGSDGYMAGIRAKTELAAAQAQTEVPAEPAPAPAAKPAKAKTPKAPKEPKAPAVAAAPAKTEAADFLLFVGGSFYDKSEFIAESAKLGISRRMPSHKLPKGLISGKSRVFVATSGARKFEGEPEGEVFGYFVPDAVEFISTEGNGQHADIISSLKLRPDSRIITSIAQEAPRECGTRVEGGTYIVVDKGDSPLHQLVASAKYVGNHFRGLLKLTADQVEAFTRGGTVATLIDEVCMCCGAAMK